MSAPKFSVGELALAWSIIGSRWDECVILALPRSDGLVECGCCWVNPGRYIIEAEGQNPSNPHGWWAIEEARLKKLPGRDEANGILRRLSRRAPVAA